MVNSNVNPGDIYSYFAIDDQADGNNNAGISVNTFTPYGTGMTMQMYGGGYSNNAGNNTIFFAENGNLHFVRDNIDMAGTLQVDNSISSNNYIKSTNSFTQAKMSSGQTISAGSDVVVNFNNVTINNNGWFDTTNHRFQPTVAGTYDITIILQVATGTGNGQMNVQVNKNNGTQVYIVQDEVNKNINHSFVGSVLVDFNGTTDNVKITFYTSSNNGSQTIQDNNGSFFKAVLL